jgi:serine/threonine protein kinase
MGTSDFEEILSSFELACQRGTVPPDLSEYLGPDADTSLLVELIHIDMDYRLRRSDEIRIEDYLLQYPILDRLNESIAELAFSEYQLREHRGYNPSSQELLSRFPEHREQISEMLASHRRGKLRDSKIGLDQETVDLSLEGVQQGRWLGPYRLLDLIGQGGMGSVYSAEQQRPIRRQVAIKVIKAGLDTKRVQQRFDAEKQALALMDHPNIARVLDAGVTPQGEPYFAMELVDGIPITRYCDDHQLTVEGRLELFSQVCSAIQHAHQKGVVHRDIKPSNVLVTMVEGVARVKVIDFGLAKAIQSETYLTEGSFHTEFGLVLGTFQYMSPEQASSDTSDIDTRSDVYSLGVLLYELLTGSTPIEKERLRTMAIDAVLGAIRHEEPVRRLGLSGDSAKGITTPRQIEFARLQQLLKGDLDWIVMKALEKERSRRYDSVSALAQDVRRFRDNEEVSARPPSVGYRLAKTYRRHRAALLTMAGVGLLLLGATITSLTFAYQANVAAVQLSQTVDTMMRRNSIMLKQITELAVMERIGESQGRAQINGMVDDCLKTWSNSKLDSHNRIAALGLLVDIADAMMEFQKADSSAYCLERTLRSIEQLENDPIVQDLLVQLFKIRAESRLVAIGVAYDRKMASGESPESVSKRIVRTFLELDFKQSKASDVGGTQGGPVVIITPSILRCAESLLSNAIYSQRGSMWVLSTPPIAQQVYEHALSGVDRQDPTVLLPLAALECQYGFMVHKGFLQNDWGRPLDRKQASMVVRSHYTQARGLLDHVDEDILTDADRSVHRELRSRIANFFGMSYSITQEFDRAQAELQDAWRLRKLELDQAPKSQLGLRRAANTVWNLADVFLNEIISSHALEDARRVQIEEASLLYRHEAIELCRRWVEVDRNKDSEIGFLVNILRCFHFEATTGGFDKGVELLRQAEKLVPLRDVGWAHSDGGELFLAASILHLRYPEELEYRKLYESSLKAYEESLLKLVPPSGQSVDLRHRNSIERILRVMQAGVYSGLDSDAQWQGIMGLSERILSAR